MSTHSICFYGELEKIILELSSDVDLLQLTLEIQASSEGWP